MQTGDTYVNVHSLNYPNGELRGQLAMAPEPGSFLLVGVSFLLLGTFAFSRKHGRRAQAPDAKDNV